MKNFFLLKILFFSFIALALVLSTGCKGTEDGLFGNGAVGPGLGTVSLKVQGTEPGSLSSSSNAPSETVLDVTDETGATVGSFKLTEARIVIQTVEFETNNFGNFDAFVEFSGPFIVDLLNDTVTPSIDAIPLSEGLFNEVLISLGPVEEEDEEETQLLDPSDELHSHSVLIKGLYTGPSANGPQTDTPMTITFDVEENFALTGPEDTSEGLQVGASIVNEVIIAFRLSKWLDFSSDVNVDGVKPSQLMVDNGTISLNDSSTGDNALLHDFIGENILESADYGIDEDEDGELDIDEDDDPDYEDDDDDCLDEHEDEE